MIDDGCAEEQAKNMSMKSCLKRCLDANVGTRRQWNKAVAYLTAYNDETIMIPSKKALDSYSFEAFQPEG